MLHAIVDGEEIALTAGGNGASTQPAVSSDGRFVAFQSAATNLVTGDADGFIDIYRAEIDPVSRTVIGIDLVSSAASGANGNGNSVAPSISNDGQLIAFRSAASNLVDGDRNGIADIFVKDMASGLVQRLELDGDSSGVIPSGCSWRRRTSRPMATSSPTRATLRSSASSWSPRRSTWRRWRSARGRRRILRR